jgi:hypothetical protein
MPNARIKNNPPIEIVRADERHHTSVRKPRTHASRRASEAPMSARAVAFIRPAPIIISLPAFLCTRSGKRQLHDSRYYLVMAGPDYFRYCDKQGVGIRIPMPSRCAPSHA